MQVGGTAAHLPTATKMTIPSYATFHASLPQITPDRVAVALCALLIGRCEQPVRFPSHPCALSHPRARATVTSTAQIVLAAMHADSGRRQGHAPGAHYPNASAARHRLLFAASRTQERRRGVKQAGNRWRQNFGAGRSDRWLAAVSETIHVG